MALGILILKEDAKGMEKASLWKVQGQLNTIDDYVSKCGFLNLTNYLLCQQKTGEYSTERSPVNISPWYVATLTH